MPAPWALLSHKPRQGEAKLRQQGLAWPDQWRRSAASAGCIVDTAARTVAGTVVGAAERQRRRKQDRESHGDLVGVFEPS